MTITAAAAAAAAVLTVKKFEEISRKFIVSAVVSMGGVQRYVGRQVFALSKADRRMNFIELDAEFQTEL